MAHTNDYDDFKISLTKEEKNKCKRRIHTASAAAAVAGAGLAQVPLSDSAVITPIQVGMIISLGSILGIKVSDGAAKGILAGMATSFVGRGTSQILIGWIPGLGNAVNATTAGGITEALGWAAVGHFCSMRQHYMTEGGKIGYKRSSIEYEKKFIKQAEEFAKQIEKINKKVTKKKRPQ